MAHGKFRKSQGNRMLLLSYRLHRDGDGWYLFTEDERKAFERVVVAVCESE